MSRTSAHRPTRRYWRVGMAIVVVGVVAAAAATAAVLVRAPTVAVSPNSSPSATGEVGCRTSVPSREPQLCRTVLVGGSTYRYAVLALPGAAAREIIILDPGGPGISSLATNGIGGMLGSLGIADLPDGVAFVLVEEPWVTAPVPTGSCAAASSRFLSAVATGPLLSSTVATLKAHCSQTEYGWSPARYRTTIAAISQQLRMPVTGFAGASFAAYRLAWLLDDARFPITRAALANPLLPELAVVEVLRHQADMVTASAQATAPTPGTEVAPGIALAAAASRLPATIRDSHHATRGLRPEQLEQQADAYIGRYGENQLSIARLAYYQELCAAGFALPGTPSWDGSGSNPYDFLAALHGGCPMQLDSRPMLLSTRAKLCLSVSSSDAVIPSQRIAQLLHGIQFHTSDLPHSQIGGLSRCRDFLLGKDTP